MKEAATALSGMFEIFIAYMLFSKFGKVKFKKSVSIPVIIAATLLEGVMTLFFSMTPVMPLFFFVSVFIITLIFDLGLPKKLLLCILFLVISVAAETVTVYGVCAISGISLKELKSSGIQYTLSVIISAFLILLIQQVIRRGKNRKTKLPRAHKIMNHPDLALLLMPLMGLFFEFLFAGVFTTIIAVFREIIPYPGGFSAWLKLWTSAGLWTELLYMGILSCGVAYTLQVVCQKNLDPTVASLAMSFESVFAAIAGWLILNQKMDTKEILGCILMFIAIIVAQLNFQKNKNNIDNI